MTMVSARPDFLVGYRERLWGIDSGFSCGANGLRYRLETHHARSPGFAADRTALADQLTRHAAAMEALDQWVGRVGEAFRAADGSGQIGPALLVRVTGDALARAMATGLRRELTELAGAPPAQVALWWQGLSAAQQTVLINAAPEVVGNLNGVSAVGRDRANRIVLRRELDAFNARRAELLANQPAKFLPNGYANRAWFDWKDDLASVERTLGGLNAIDRRLNAGPLVGGGPAFLMGLDTSGNGRAIVAINDPDTAHNVITYVPGTGAGLDNARGDIGRSDVMVQSAARATLGREITSSITWIGYDAPPSVPKAVSNDYAEDARTDLRAFMGGLRETHDGEPSHNTIIGHSYGSTTVGYAMRDEGLPVDKVIFVGSPGVGVDHARDLHIDPDRVYVGLHPDDEIRYGRIGPTLFGSPWEVAGDLLTGDRQQVHGRDPSVDEFGARDLPVASGSPWTPPDPRGGAHSEYWDPNSESLKAIGQIAVGDEPTRD